VEVYSLAHSYSPPGLDKGEWSVSRLIRYNLLVKSSWYSLDRRLGGAQKPIWSRRWRESFYSFRESNPARPAHSIVTIL